VIAANVDKILKFSVARAAQEDFGNRELGPIHLLKLVYLADLEYAGGHEGRTFTETPWRFHHFGPWDNSAFQVIAPAMEAVGAKARPVVSVRFESETTFWSMDPLDPYTTEVYEGLDNELPVPLTRAITHAIHEFGRDTAALLDYVYKTPPMVAAAPGALLDFTKAFRAQKAFHAFIPMIPASPSKSQRRAQQDKKQAFLERLRRTPASGPRPGCIVPPPAPVDDLFANGVRWLDSLAGSPVPEIQDGVLEFDPSVWTSDMRIPSELS